MNALVVGGSSGIGLAIVLNLMQRCDVEHVHVVDKKSLPQEYANNKIEEHLCDLSDVTNLRCLIEIPSIQMLYITVGFGHLKPFGELTEQYIQDIFAVNALSPLLIIKHYYNKLENQQPFYCGVMVSIAGHLNSPLYSMYSATKAALGKGIEAINVELEEHSSPNRILEVSPGHVQGTGFNGGVTQLDMIADFATSIVEKSINREICFIPQYEDIYKNVLNRYHTNPHQFGKESYQYKMQSLENRV